MCGGGGGGGGGGGMGACGGGFLSREPNRKSQKLFPLVKIVGRNGWVGGKTWRCTHTP